MRRRCSADDELGASPSEGDRKGGGRSSHAGHSACDYPEIDSEGRIGKRSNKAHRPAPPAPLHMSFAIKRSRSDTCSLLIAGVVECSCGKLLLLISISYA